MDMKRHHKIFTARLRKHSWSSSHFFASPFLSWCHRAGEEGEGERGGAIMGRRGREGGGRGVVPTWVEEGEGEKCGATMGRRGRGERCGATMC